MRTHCLRLVEVGSLHQSERSVTAPWFNTENGASRRVGPSQLWVAGQSQRLSQQTQLACSANRPAHASEYVAPSCPIEMTCPQMGCLGLPRIRPAYHRNKFRRPLVANSSSVQSAGPDAHLVYTSTRRTQERFACRRRQKKRVNIFVAPHPGRKSDASIVDNHPVAVCSAVSLPKLWICCSGLGVWHFPASSYQRLQHSLRILCSLVVGVSPSSLTVCH